MGHQGTGVPGEDEAAAWMRSGRLVAYDYRRALARLRAPRLQRAGHGADRPTDGLPARQNRGRGSTDRPSDMYSIPNRKMGGDVVESAASRLKRPCAPEICAIRTVRKRRSQPSRLSMKLPRRRRWIRWNSACKMLTAETTDDAGFRRARSIAVLKAAAAAYGWDSRPSPKSRGTGNILTGRGVRLLVPRSNHRGPDRRG